MNKEIEESDPHPEELESEEADSESYSDSDSDSEEVSNEEEERLKRKCLEIKEIPPQKIQGDFAIYNLDTLFEKVKLDGNYGIKMVVSEENFCELDENINCQAIFRVGNVFYRNDTENIFKLISMFSDYTHKDLDNVEKCTSKPIQLKFGTICPTRKELFTFKTKKFVAFGRYIFGYDINYAAIVRKGINDKCIKNRQYIKCFWERSSEITNDRVILSVPSSEGYSWTDDYVYSFMIYDFETGVLDAFGLYR